MLRRRLMLKDSDKGKYVDLGLPSGTLWATMNVGASSETDYGNYYMYGKGAAQYGETAGDKIYQGKEDPLAASADTAVQVWGGSWHMPTKAQFEELINNTTSQWVTDYKGSGINGRKYTSKTNPYAYVFFPAAGYFVGLEVTDIGSYGYYWSSSPRGSGYAYHFSFIQAIGGVYDEYRNYGFSVRPVIG